MRIQAIIAEHEHANAAALDTAPNVAARVLAIHPRYLRLGPADYEALFGADMLHKAERIDAILQNHRLEFWHTDTPENRRAATQFLDNPEQLVLLGQLASIVQMPSTPAQMLTEELDEIDRARALRHPQGMNYDTTLIDDPVPRAINRRPIGLAFSGGGIRSATFNLGILQSLADLGLLGHVDYLSTVSGGGYIGSWLTSWMQQESNAPLVESSLSPVQAPASQPEPEPIQFLRDYSNYLTPQKGMFSADTWTMLMIWIRNTFLNLIILVFSGLCVLTIPRLVGIAAKATEGSFLNTEINSVLAFTPLRLITVLLLFVATVLMGYNLRSFESKVLGKKRVWYQEQHWVQLGVVVPVLIAAGLESFCLWSYLSELDPTQPYPWGDWKLWIPAIFVFLLLLVTQITGDFWGCYLRDKRRRLLAKFSTAPFVFFFYPLFSSFVYWGALVLIGRWMWSWRPDAGLWHAMSFGTPLFLIAFALTMTIEIGLMGRSFPDDRREWIGRLGAWVFIFSVGVIALFTIALYGPQLVAWTIDAGGTWLAGVLPAGWLATTIAALLAAKPENENGQEPKQPSLPKRILTAIGPYVFILGLFLILTCTLQLVLGDSACYAANPNETLVGYCNADVPCAPTLLLDVHWDLLNFANGWWTFWAFVISAGIAILFSLTVDINEFSMHHFYKNRLVRCFLGACRGRKRTPHPFTGFDANDERRLCTLRHDAVVETSDGFIGPYFGPYPIINTTLNLVKGDNLSWQDRKGSSFIFTPKYSGWNKETNQAGAWVDTATYRTTNVYAYPDNNKVEGGIGLGTAMAISGAAASPNMGYQSSAPMAFLMTIFNVRLGWWLGNPRLDAWRESGPTWGLNYLMTELFGLTNDSRKYVYLSDGGHFENLGIYELVRRRCLVIVACDAEQDGDMTFGGLGNAIRKCRTDFGVEIKIDVSRLRKDPETGRSEEHCAVGTIQYQDRDSSGERVTGTLVYIKSSITGDEPTDVLEYRSRNKDFPHQTTADQFFDESQFESYRRLGYHVGREELHVGKLVLLYADSIARLEGDRLNKFKGYAARIHQIIESTHERELAMLKPRVRPRLGHLLARPALKGSGDRPADIMSDAKVREYYDAVFKFMADAVEEEHHAMSWVASTARY